MNTKYLIVLLFLISSCRHASTTDSSDSLVDSGHSETYMEMDSIRVISNEVLEEDDAGGNLATLEDLNALNDSILERLKRLDRDNPLRQNIHAFGPTDKAVEIYLAINTKHWQDEFKRYLSDSPNIVFKGPTKPIPIKNSIDSVAEIPGIILMSDSNDYPADSETVSFTLKNESDRSITFGDPYTVAYQGADNEWYELPQTGMWNDIGYELHPGGTHQINAKLYPRLNNNRPGTYRLYKRIRTAGGKKHVWIMTEFLLK